MGEGTDLTSFPPHGGGNRLRHSPLMGENRANVIPVFPPHGGRETVQWAETMQWGETVQLTSFPHHGG